MKNVVLTSLAVFGLSLVCAQTASAQVETFMLVPNIEGESTVQGYEKWIVVTSLTQTFDSAVKNQNPCTVAVTKPFDKAGPLLWTAAVTGQVFNEVRIDIQKSGEKQAKFYELIVTNARVTSISSQPSALSETLTLVGTSAKLSYFQQKPDGTAGGTVSSTVTCK